MTLDILIFLLYTIRHAIDILPDAPLYMSSINQWCILSVLSIGYTIIDYRLLQLIDVNEVDNMNYQPRRFDIH